MIKKAIESLYREVFPERFKGSNELSYWKEKKQEEVVLANDHYEYFYTKYFNLQPNFYKNKRIADIGCGPRGSLEWAEMAQERIGLDPLARSYLKLGAKNHKMKYVTASSDSIPFSDDYFDVVASFNSLDHVKDLDKTINEIARVTKPGGLFLLISDVNHEPTPCEPIYYSWDITKQFLAKFKIVEEFHYEVVVPGIYQSINENIKYDHNKQDNRHGIITVKFKRNGKVN
jgi:ubiquinone/menaquinone biosynthesis C-methylase UbiE